MSTFAQRLQSLIDVKIISQREVAEALGVDESRVSNWLSGRVKSPHRLTIIKLAQLFDCDIEWLKTGKGQKFLPVNDNSKKNNRTIPGYEKVVATIQPGTVRPQEDQPSKTEMLVMTSKVLEPGTIYRPALASNIRAFYQAVLGGEKGIADRGDQTPDSDLLIMTTKVLESSSIFRSALVSNILAFHQAVQGEIEMSEMRDEVAALRNEIREMKELIAAKFQDSDQKREAQGH